MPSLEELTTRYEAICGKIQDSITVIEAHMGGKEEISFNINQAIYTLGGLDIIQTEHDNENFIVVLEEYHKMLRLD